MSFDLDNDKPNVFVSYKSEDANVVRSIVEQLKANGISVWFTEYEVLLHNYEQFQIEIEEGVGRADYYLLFTNNRWARSKYDTSR